MLLYLYSLSYSLTSSLDSGLMYFPLSLNVACIVIPTWFFFPLITFSSRESKQLDKCPAPMSPRLSCLLSLTLFNPGKINGSVHIVLDSYVCLLLWKNVIWLCYLITTFICLSCQHDCEHLEIRSGVKPELI